MYQTLEAAKAEWQGDLTVLIAYIDKHLRARIEITQGSNTSADAPTYNIFRYWETASGAWSVSVDAQEFSAADIFHHLAYQLGEIIE